MKIRRLELKNFGSYYGEDNVLDFKTKTGVEGYAIFGQIGRGKTTLLQAILWCLYGQVKSTVTLDDTRVTRKRPIVDERQQLYGKKSWCLPLLCDRAYKEGVARKDGVFEMQVRLIFDHEGSVYRLLRLSSNKSGLKTPAHSGHMTTEAHLSIEGKSVPAARVQAKIDKVIPPKISKFFFVEVDAISNYSSLLFSDESGGSIVEDVEAILGMPAIDDSEEDFVKLAQSTERTLQKMRKSKSKGDRSQKAVTKIDEILDEINLDISNLEVQIKALDELIEKIDLKLSSETSITGLIERKKECQTKIEKCDGDLENLYSERRELMGGGLWKSLIQKGLDNAIDTLGISAEEKETLVQQKARERETITYLESEINKGGAKCKVCGNESEGITLKEKAKKAREVVKLGDSVASLEDQIQKIGEPSSQIIRLTKYKDSSGYKRLKELEHSLGRIWGERSKEKSVLRRIEKDLENHDELAIAEMQSDKIKKIERRGDLKGELKHVQRAQEVETDKKKRLVAKLPAVVGDLKFDEATKKMEIYNWLSDCFKSAMAEFKEDARISVQSISTDAWKRMVPTPKKYKELRIGDNWGIEVIGSRGDVLPIGNPGHRQTLAVCVFDGLRKSSNLQFPTFFDNPGSNISEEVVQKMAEYFWEDDSGQMVMLSHSGGLKEAESVERYGDRLARSWRISYSEGESTTSVIEEVD